MKSDLMLVRLNAEQISLAKQINGPRKEITHGLICGPYGQIFGTEKFCRKYYSAWVEVFPLLFGRGVEVSKYEITEFESTFNLVNVLFEHHHPLEKALRLEDISRKYPQKKNKVGGLISRVWGRISGS